MHVDLCETMNSILHYYEFLYTLYWYCNPQKVHEYVLVFLEKAMSVWSLYRLHTHPGGGIIVQLSTVACVSACYFFVHWLLHNFSQLYNHGICTLH